VTGGSGFLGGRVIPQLVAAGHEVSALSRSSNAASRVRVLGATAIPGDLDVPASLDDAFRSSGAEALVNLASLGFGHAPAILSAADAAGIRRGVFVSTTAIFTTLDARSKSIRTAAEEAIRESLLAWTIIRPTMIYGSSGDRNLWRLLQLIRRSPVVPVPGGGRRLQQPVHVDDLAQAIVVALERDTSVGRAYDVAGPDPLSLRHIIEQTASASGRHVRLLPVPLGLAIHAVRAYERLARRPRLRAEQLERLAEDKSFDITPARNDLSYTPRSFAIGIAEEAAALR